MKKILIVDDSMLTRAIIGKTLTEAGFLVIEAENGIKGVESFEKNSPDLVITDFMMPEMDGIEFAKHVKQRSKRTPVILQSVEFDKDTKIRAKKVGIDDYLFKDFEKKDLVKKVKELTS